MIQIELNYVKNWFNNEIMKNNGGINMAILSPEAEEHLKDYVLKQREEKGIEKGIEKRIEKGIEIGEEKTMQKVIKAINMIKQGFTIEDTSKATGLTEMQINQLCIFK